MGDRGLCLVANLAVDDGFHHIVFCIKQNEVGGVAGGYLAEVVEPEGLSLVPRGGFHQLAEGLAGKLLHILEALGKAQGRAGEVAGLQAGHTALHNDGQATERAGTIGHPRASQGVRDHHHLGDVLVGEGELEHVFTQVNLVANDFNLHVFVQHTGANKADFAVVLRAHLVAEVGEVLKTGGLSLLEVGIRCSGVAGRAGDAGGTGLGNEVHCAGHFRSHGDKEYGVDVVQHLYLFKIGRAYKGGVLGTTLFGVDVGPFQVYTGGLGAIGGGSVFFNNLANIHEGLGAQGQGGGQPGGNTLFHLAVGNGADAFNLAVASVAAAGAVRVDVDKARHQHVAAGVDDLIGLGGFTGGENGSNLAAVNQDGTSHDVDTRGDDVRIGDERFHDVV